ncbi:MAG: cofactor [Planctomycetota bacterium]|jgi:molecular chaperone GrpE
MSDGTTNDMNPAPDELDQAAAAFADAAGSGSFTQLAEMQAKIDDLQGRLMRSYADLENYRRRVQRDQDDARKFESLRLVRDLLPGLDGLNRAISSGEQTGDRQVLLNGIRMVAQQFRDILKLHSAEQIEAVGRPFDPNLHEALTQIPSADHEPMTVLQEVEVGYRMHDRVVRPARVIVSCAPPQA